MDAGDLGVRNIIEYHRSVTAIAIGNDDRNRWMDTYLLLELCYLSLVFVF